MNTNTNHKYNHNLTAGDRFIAGMSIVRTVESVKVEPGFRRQVVVITCVGGEVIRRPHGGLCTIA